MKPIRPTEFCNSERCQEIVDEIEESKAELNGKTLKVLPLAHPRQIGGLGFHSKWWKKIHQGWENKINRV